MFASKIQVIFSGAKTFNISCYDFLNDTFFIKNLRENNKTPEKIILYAPNLEIGPREAEAIGFLLSESIRDHLERIVVSETEESYQITYKFTENIPNFITNLSIEEYEKILIVLDCLDLKPQMLAIFCCIPPEKKSFEEIVASVRKYRQPPPKVFIK